ncbi:hypothetical protein D3C87_1084420 [compost metagenome]
MPNPNWRDLHRDFPSIYPMRSIIAPEEEALRARISVLEDKLAAAERVIAEARPLASVLDHGATLIGSTLCVTSGLSRAISAYDKTKGGQP